MLPLVLISSALFVEYLPSSKEVLEVKSYSKFLISKGSSVTSGTNGASKVYFFKD
jgi:hypothetical protein